MPSLSTRRLRAARLLVGLVACLGCSAHPAGGSSAASGSIGPLELSVVVTEEPGIVHLRVLLPEEVSPGTVEVQVDERNVMVLAEDTDGRQRRSRRLRLSQPVSQAGAEAQYEPDGSLTITLHGAAGGL